MTITASAVAISPTDSSTPLTATSGSKPASRRTRSLAFEPEAKTKRGVIAVTDQVWTGRPRPCPRKPVSGSVSVARDGELDDLSLLGQRTGNGELQTFPDGHVGMKAYTRIQRYRTGRRFREETGEVVVAGSGSCWWYLHCRS
jgi:hypothetical protein